MDHLDQRRISLRRKAVFSNVVLSGTVLVLLGMLEVLLRLFYGSGFPIPVPNSAYHLDQESGIRLNPHESRVFKRDVWNGGDTIRWTSNGSGYRGAELMAHSDYRIVVFGDSNIQAEFSKLENTYSAVLQTLLRESTGRNVEVVNAGTVGAGPDQNLSRMSQELPILRPNLVIFHVFPLCQYE